MCVKVSVGVGAGGGGCRGEQTCKKEKKKELRNSSNRTKSQTKGMEAQEKPCGGKEMEDGGECRGGGGVWVRVDTRCPTHLQQRQSGKKKMIKHQSFPII